MLAPPQPGIYDITDLPAFTVINNITVVMTLPLSGDGPGFVAENFTTSYPPVNGAGMTTLILGGTARTSGTSQSYGDDVYSGELNIEIDY